MQEASAKSKKVAKKVDKISEMTVALKDYTAMMRERFSGNRVKSSGTFEQFAQSATVTMASKSEWLDTFLAYDFDESYFDNVDYDDAGEIFAYMQRNYDKQPMRDSILTGQEYMEELNSNPNKCLEMFRMTCLYLLHLVDKLVGHGYLKVLRALHSYARHLIKPDPDVVFLLEHLRVNKYWSWFEGGKVVLMTHGCWKKQSMTRNMDSHGHLQIILLGGLRPAY
ncbi:hypothetical protein CMV_010319 [Castanea mollissima]|uniref:Uncharacterized protein n=1 Tax=Castanea mollissima TaxID=60419 RepID=A0A8J4RJ99_9ROSI|nr:hypothetical protein CMV_010319 [Castanea mollissima]